MITVNLEPDLRVTPIDGTARWDGVEPTMAIVEDWRRGHAERRVGWYWRCDPSIEAAMGDAGWALQRWSGPIAAALERGDEVGVHPHLWRWSPTFGTFVADAADDAWKEQCIRTSVEAVRRNVGVSPRCSQMGDGYFDAAIAAAMVAHGLAIDLTVEAGGPQRIRLGAGEWTTGLIPDRTRAPRRPYRPSRRDALRAARFRPVPGMVAIPLTTSTTPVVLDRVTVDEAGTPANLGFDPYRFQHIVSTGLLASAAAGRPYLQVNVRTDVGTNPGLARHVRDNLDWLAAGLGGLADRFGGIRFVNPPDVVSGV